MFILRCRFIRHHMRYDGAMSERPSAKGEESSSATAFLLQYLQSHEALCPACGYNLRNLTHARCPECGKEVQLTVGLKESYLAPFVALLVALGLPAGVGVLTLIIVAKEGIRLYRFAGDWSHNLETLSVLAFQASIVPLIAAIGMRRRIFRMEKRRQWLIAGIALMEPLLIFGLFLLAVLTS
jgi:hypothetical protein